ncbi:MAG TPA: hypothetical protein VF546_05145 [Pyrinomonadaceae bacterium]|jgi:hypothetical protein
MQNDRDNVQTQCSFNPFTVSAVYCDGSGKLISHCYASDAQAARDQVLMETGGAAVIASVFAGHLVEADAATYTVQDDLAA